MRLKVAPGAWLSDLLRSFGIVYSREYAPELAETVQPVYQINPGDTINNVSAYSDSWSDGDHAFIGRSTTAAVAGQYGQHLLLNPAASGVLLYVDRITFAVGSSDNVALMAHAAALASPGTFLNKRVNGPVGGGRTSYTTAAGAIAGATLALWDSLTRTSLSHHFDPPLKLEQGQGIALQPASVNNAFTSTWEWREVPA